ncbi:MAG: GvpL/GvpF family gas vesicle protein, partial [Candidatus Aminicenantes bacterium]|nr:GvpL/GvpF family gas vesicle protein [Candidatus Aminicenantes bacterium]
MSTEKEEGKYIYCVINSTDEKDFGNMGIGGRGDKVHSVCYKDIAAVVSTSPIKKYSIRRESILTHQKIMERLMEDYTILPVKFSTVAGGKEGVDVVQRIRLEVLKARHEELKDLLAKMDNKMELGLKALWLDMKTIFYEIVEENPRIKRMRRMAFSGKSVRFQKQQVTLGEEVKNALEAKKAKEEDEIIASLKRCYVDKRTNKLFGDNMIINAAFLVDKSRSEEFDNLIKKLDSTH